MRFGLGMPTFQRNVHRAHTSRAQAWIRRLSKNRPFWILGLLTFGMLSWTAWPIVAWDERPRSDLLLPQARIIPRLAIATQDTTSNPSHAFFNSLDDLICPLEDSRSIPRIRSQV